MGFGSDTGGGTNEGFGGNESGIGGGSSSSSGGMGGQGGFGGLGIGNPGSYGGQQSVGAPGFGGTGSIDGGYGGPSQAFGGYSAEAMAQAMAQSDIQAMQNNMERGLASNPSFGLNEVARGMDNFTGMPDQQQQQAYGTQADNDPSRSVASRSIGEQLDAYNAAKKVGANTAPYSKGIKGGIASGIIDFAASKIGPINSVVEALTGRTVGQTGLDMGFADVSRANLDLGTKYGEIDRGPANTGEYQNLITSLSRPSRVVRG